MIFTSAAATKVAELIKGETDPNTNLRVYVQGGGCSGMKYGFTFDSIIAEDDFVLETNEVKLLVDPISYEILREAEVDYADNGLNGSHFTIRNPNATGRCGCGQSFNQ